MTTLLLVVGGVVGFPLVGLPILLYVSQRFRIPAEVIPIDPKAEPLPEEARVYFREVYQSLIPLGFQYLGTFGILDLVPNVRCLLVMYVDRKTDDQAMTTLIVGGAAGQPVLKLKYVEFVTRYEDGTTVQTSNSSQLGSFKEPPEVHSIRLVQVNDPAMLLQHHQSFKRHFAPTGKTVLRLDRDCGGDPLAYLSDIVLDETFADQVPTGYLQPCPGGYRPTLLGAFKMAWKELPPFKQIRQTRSQRDAARLLRIVSPYA
jgi:hypothetical protein